MIATDMKIIRVIAGKTFQNRDRSETNIRDWALDRKLESNDQTTLMTENRIMSIEREKSPSEKRSDLH